MTHIETTITSSGYQTLGNSKHTSMKVHVNDRRKDERDKKYESNVAVFANVNFNDTYSEAISSIYTEMVNYLSSFYLNNYNNNNKIIIIITIQ